MVALAKDLTNEQLADVIRAMKITGISPTRFEQECLDEAAERLEYLDIICARIHKLTRSLEKTNKLYMERVDKGCIL